MKRFIALGLMAILSACSDIPQRTQVVAPERLELRGKIVRYGIYKRLSLDTRIPQPSTATGFTSIGDVELISQSDFVTLKAGEGIGFEYKFYLETISEPNRIEVVIDHPAITNKEGKTYYGSRDYRALPDKPGIYGSYIGYFFSQEFEMVPGIWNVQLLYKGQLVLENKFDVSF